MSIETSPPAVQRIKGRIYKVTVNKRHRPAQIHRDVNVVTYEGEVTDDNAVGFELRYVDIELTRDVAKIIGDGFHDNMSYNNMVGVLLEVAAKHPDEIADMMSTLGYAPDEEAKLRQHISDQREAVSTGV